MFHRAVFFLCMLLEFVFVFTFICMSMCLFTSLFLCHGVFFLRVRVCVEMQWVLHDCQMNVTGWKRCFRVAA